jgi:hypothetical protein
MGSVGMVVVLDILFPFYGKRSGFSPAAGRGAASQIDKETLKKRISNNEYRMSNIEVMYSVYFIKRTERSETILRHSAVRYSIFCGSLFKFW